MAVDQKYFTGIAQELLAKINRVNYLIEKANLKSGEYHEEIVRHYLKGFMTGRYVLKAGYIHLDERTASRQVDILVIDENVPFTYLFQEGDFVIVRPEPVMAVIETKTKLSLGEFRKAFANIVAAKRIKQQCLRLSGHIFGAIFGFFSNKTIDTSTLSDWFKDSRISHYGSEQGSLWPDQITLFQNERTLFRHEDSSGSSFYQLMRTSSSADSRASQLALLVGILVAVCDSEDRRKYDKFSNFDLNQLIGVGNLTFDPEKFSPGKGLWLENEIP